MSKKHIITENGAVSLKRHGCSVNGNPCYLVDFFDGVSVLHGKTASDASYCYTLSTGHFKNVTVQYHITGAGRVIFDDIKREEK